MGSWWKYLRKYIKSLLNLLKEIKEDEHISVENIINAFINRDIETGLLILKMQKNICI